MLSAARLLHTIYHGVTSFSFVAALKSFHLVPVLGMYLVNLLFESENQLQYNERTSSLRRCVSVYTVFAARVTVRRFNVH